MNDYHHPIVGNAARSSRFKTSFAYCLLAGALALSACSNSSSTRSGGNNPEVPAEETENQGGTGLWDMLRKSRAEKNSQVAAQKEIDKELAAGRASVPKDWQVKMDKWWQDFLNRDPSWVGSFAEWRALGPRAVDILVENLILVMVTAYDIGNGVMYKESSSALYEVAERSVPYLVECLAGHFGDDVVRSHCVELLSRIGTQALPAVQKSYRNARTEGKFDLLRAASRMSASEAVPFLAQVIDDEDDFRLRITAIEGIGKSGDPKGAPVLIKCLDDDDVSVRKFAAGYVGAFKDMSAVGPLIRCMSAAESQATPDNREGDVAANCRQSLNYLTGRNFRTGKEWDTWWRRNSGN